MLNAELPPERANREERLPPTVAAPIGAAALAGVATAIVLAMWFAFYFLVFTPRSLP
jgi:hypothetical protein